jgi:dipeptidyl aminopeptidase/acylaminoacyl peptidase
MDAVLAFPFVDPTRVVIGGQSRGGILSIAYAGQRPEQVKGVVNFVGGWRPI